MNDRPNSAPANAPLGPPAVEPSDGDLPRGLQLGGFEIQRMLARSASTVVYLATDHALAKPVALLEYLPARLVRRDAGLHLRATEARHEDLVARGRAVFIDEARMLAQCDHPALVRVTQLFEALGSAYCVMPVYSGRRLTELRGEMMVAPDEAALRALLDQLLGAVEAIHRAGHVHGGITPANILLRDDDRPLLLGSDAAAREVASDLVDSLMATLEIGAAAKPADAVSAAPPVGAARDLYMLADTLRFCITGVAPAPAGTLRTREPLAAALVREFAVETRPQYSPELLGALDAALSTSAEERPQTVAQFREWLERGVPRAPIQVAPISLTVAAPAPAAAAATAPVAPLADSSPPTQAHPKPAAGLTDDPITPERPPWIAPPLPPELQRAATTRARHRRKLIAAAGVGLVVVGLAAAAVWWSVAPEIRMELVAAPRVEAAPQPVAPVTPAAVEPAATTPPPAMPPSAAASGTPAPAPTPTAPVPAAEPAPALVVNPNPAAAAASTAEPGVDSSAPVADTSARPVRGAVATPDTSPRAACADRTEFALYRCMQQQCEANRWATHPQCIRLRRDDRVD